MKSQQQPRYPTPFHGKGKPLGAKIARLDYRPADDAYLLKIDSGNSAAWERAGNALARLYPDARWLKDERVWWVQRRTAMKLALIRWPHLADAIACLWYTLA